MRKKYGAQSLMRKRHCAKRQSVIGNYEDNKLFYSNTIIHLWL
jgi:hypothetical protein